MRDSVPLVGREVDMRESIDDSHWLTGSEETSGSLATPDVY